MQTARLEEPMTENELYYLRSIRRQLIELHEFAAHLDLGN